MSRNFLVVDPAEQPEVLRALASELRVGILKLLHVDGAMNVNDIAGRLGQPQSTISSNLQVLVEAGLVRTESKKARKGNQKICHSLFDEVLVMFKHDIGALRSKNQTEFQGADAPRLDFVFTVCDQAANEECPAWDGQPVSAHWGMPDPVQAEGSDAEKSLAFQAAYGTLLNRITAFVSLPIDSLDRLSLQRAVDDIARDDEVSA